MQLSKNKEKYGALFVCMAATLWGLDGVVLTPRLFSLPVPFVVFIVHLIPFIVMTVLYGKEEIGIAKKLPKQDLFYFFLIALFGGVLGTLSIVKALFLVNFHNLTVVTLLQKLQPIFAIILARIILKERLSKNFAFWGVLALVGGYFLSFEFHLPKFDSSGNMLEASLFAILAAFSFGSSTVFGKRVLTNASFRTAMYLRYSFTTLITFFLNIALGTFAFAQVETIHWMIFLTITLVTGSGAVLLYYFGLGFIKARVATICELSFPLSSIVFDYIFNGNVLSPVQWLSVAVMLIAIYNISQHQVEDDAELENAVLDA